VTTPSPKSNHQEPWRITWPASQAAQILKYLSTTATVNSRSQFSRPSLRDIVANAPRWQRSLSYSLRSISIRGGSHGWQCKRSWDSTLSPLSVLRYLQCRRCPHLLTLRQSPAGRRCPPAVRCGICRSESGDLLELSQDASGWQQILRLLWKVFGCSCSCGARCSP
jgi:hypothetical protein